MPRFKNLVPFLKKNKQSDDIKNLILSEPTIPARTFKNVSRLCKVVSVYDGDTINIITKLDPYENYSVYSLRLCDLNAPEVRNSKSFEDSELHKTAGLHVRQQLELFLKEKNNYVVIDFIGEDKYGRLLGYIYRANIIKDHYFLRDLYTYERELVSVNDLMLNKKLVKKYDGSGNKEFSIEELRFILNTQLC